MSNGSMLGRTIADSYFKRTHNLSESQGYSAEPEITMSLINLNKIPDFVTNIDSLADYLTNHITDSASVLSLTKSVDSSEGNIQRQFRISRHI